MSHVQRGCVSVEAEGKARAVSREAPNRRSHDFFGLGGEAVVSGPEVFRRPALTFDPPRGNVVPDDLGPGAGLGDEWGSELDCGESSEQEAAAAGNRIERHLGGQWSERAKGVNGNRRRAVRREKGSDGGE
ncbi:MAG: hypothetical protein B9S36_02215 [Verrucomicrobiia bacterium Tous-C2TDCM]|nr:MAG: hypothetical protein B9S36_02215 [Verrucomicrobiae bacterium Tous-C2TDCM]